jgi:hypothetical protein
MAKKIPPHVGLKISAHGMSPVSNEKGTAHLEKIENQHEAYKNKKEAVYLTGEEVFDGVLGEHGKGQIRGRDEGGAYKIRREELPVGLVVGRKDTKQGLIKIDFSGHNSSWIKAVPKMRTCGSMLVLGSLYLVYLVYR